MLIKVDEKSQAKKLTFVEDACRKAGSAGRGSVPQVRAGARGMLIVITGVTRGLGRALAEWYIAERAHGRGLRPRAARRSSTSGSPIPSPTASMRSTSPSQ